MITTFLRQVPYFVYLSDEHLTALAQWAVRRSFASDEIIFTEGERSTGLWILEAGIVKVYKLATNGDEYVLRLVAAGDAINDVAVLDGGANLANASAVSDVSAWVIPTIMFRQILDTDCTMALAVIQGLAGRVRQLVFQLEDLALRSVTGRLARFLLEQVENPALTSPDITWMLIASYLATTPETVSRSLHSLAEMGAIQFDHHRIILS